MDSQESPAYKVRSKLLGFNLRILHAASECFGLAKTGGLADVVYALPAALTDLDHDVRICVPAYRGVLARLADTAIVATSTVHGYPVRVIEGRLHNSEALIWAVDCPPLFDRAGDPYRDLHGVDFNDNALRFACFSEAVAQLAAGANATWRPDLVHLHDWQCGLAAAWIKRWQLDCRVVFTIHNLAYQGVFTRQTFEELALPDAWWHMEALEFYGNFSFMKGGLMFADAITTVSPTYAREIQTPAYGCGLDGVLRYRAASLRGLLNGIDEIVWDPETDTLIDRQYGVDSVEEGKRRNKLAAQHLLGLPQSHVPLLLFIGRLAEQKGADLLLGARAELSQLPLQIVILGSGDPALEAATRAWAAADPDRVAVRVRMDEGLAHLLTAAADVQVMPSRYEPCGLSQLYAQRYGTIPVVRSTGGLIDTVVDTTSVTLADRSATGVRFDDANSSGLLYGVKRALTLLQDDSSAHQLRRNAMQKDFSWHSSAARYVELYDEVVTR